MIQTFAFAIDKAPFLVLAFKKSLERMESFSLAVKLLDASTQSRVMKILTGLSDARFEALIQETLIRHLCVDVRNEFCDRLVRLETERLKAKLKLPCFQLFTEVEKRALGYKL